MELAVFRKKVLQSTTPESVANLLLHYLSVERAIGLVGSPPEIERPLIRSWAQAARAGAGDTALLVSVLEEVLRTALPTSNRSDMKIRLSVPILTAVGLAWRKINALNSTTSEDVKTASEQEDENPGIQLTRRERECLHLLANGVRTAVIAQSLSIKPITVGLHLTNARRKLAADTREHAVAVAVRKGLI